MLTCERCGGKTQVLLVWLEAMEIDHMCLVCFFAQTAETIDGMNADVAADAMAEAAPAGITGSPRL